MQFISTAMALLIIILVGVFAYQCMFRVFSSPGPNPPKRFTGKVVDKEYVPAHMDTQFVWIGTTGFNQDTWIQDEWFLTVSGEGLRDRQSVSLATYNAVKIGDEREGVA